MKKSKAVTCFNCMGLGIILVYAVLTDKGSRYLVPLFEEHKQKRSRIISAHSPFGEKYFNTVWEQLMRYEDG